MTDNICDCDSCMNHCALFERVILNQRILFIVVVVTVFNLIELLGGEQLFNWIWR